MGNRIPADLRLDSGYLAEDDHFSLSRIGVVDIGSNSVRLVVFDGSARSPAYFYNEKIMCGLGEGVAQTGHLNPEGKRRALDAIKRFQSLAHGMDIHPLHAVATAAMREAQDGVSFADEILAQTGLRLDIISGEKEAELSAKGVLLGTPDASGIVCDIGGSSMELTALSSGQIQNCVSTDLGPWRLLDCADNSAERRKIIRKRLQKLRGFDGNRALILVGGSWRAIGRIDMYRRNYPLQILHDYHMRPQEIGETLRLIAQSDIGMLRNQAGVSEARMRLVPYACEVLDEMLTHFGIETIAISGFGIREGILFEKMPPEIRAKDPLIAACEFAENKDARLPGCGKVLYDFIFPLFAGAPSNTLRLVRAACHLHDVSWRAHPDYRAEMCFDAATRSNLTGLRHDERVLLSLALMHRYKKKQSLKKFDGLIELLTPQAQQQAEILGKAMRFGAMLWMSNIEPMGRLVWDGSGKELVFYLRPDAAHLMSEVARGRFENLAEAMGAQAHIVAA